MSFLPMTLWVPWPNGAVVGGACLTNVNKLERIFIIICVQYAEWSGWELHVRTARMNYFITVERRKYIPPDMSTFSDFILVTQFPITEE